MLELRNQIKYVADEINDLISRQDYIIYEDTSYYNHLISIAPKHILMKLGCKFVKSINNDYIELPYRYIDKVKMNKVYEKENEKKSENIH